MTRLLSECCWQPPLDDSNSTCSDCKEHTGFVTVEERTRKGLSKLMTAYTQRRTK